MTHAALSLLLIVECLAAEVRWALPAGLLVAVVKHESGGKQRLVTKERGGCSVGAAQIYVPHCRRAAVARLLDLPTNLDAGAELLARSVKRCKQHPRWAACRRCPWGLFNAGSGSWCHNVGVIHSKIKRAIREWRLPDGSHHTPALRGGSVMRHLDDNTWDKLRKKFWEVMGDVPVSVGQDPCWEWPRAKLPSGYGVVHIPGTKNAVEYVHRVAAHIFSCPGFGSDALHTCDNPSCVCPTHLFWGTATINAEDMMRKERGRNQHGATRLGRSKISQRRLKERAVRRMLDRCAELLATRELT